ncbi:MAG: Rrf2 family transcriptional regulator [Sphaerochaetaceae bacterium]|jgi:Rrf2 family protein|nr:Rrf2 family transcriptional regulator [Sphaerochaetaceae bacterium]MDX9938978.1 Rrf2 family transcriptional regulator [Sphaerochaetaceae bacterium]
MKISTKGRYALRLMLDLARHPNQYVSIKEIASRQQISHKYLEQIIIQLVRSGFVKSIRGPQGGYTLAAEPEKITAGMVLRVMEGSLSPVQCLDDGADSCSRMGECDTIALWRKLKQAIDDVVDHVTLQDLLDRTEKPQIAMWL